MSEFRKAGTVPVLSPLGRFRSVTPLTAVIVEMSLPALMPARSGKELVRVELSRKSFLKTSTSSSSVHSLDPSRQTKLERE